MYKKCASTKVRFFSFVPHLNLVLTLTFVRQNAKYEQTLEQKEAQRISPVGDKQKERERQTPPVCGARVPGQTDCSLSISVNVYKYIYLCPANCNITAKTN